MQKAERARRMYLKWRINRINAGPPYHVELVGPYRLAQVEDARGTVALSGPQGAVFCSETRARRLCALANAGRLGAASA